MALKRKKKKQNLNLKDSQQTRTPRSYKELSDKDFEATEKYFNKQLQKHLKQIKILSLIKEIQNIKKNQMETWEVKNTITKLKKGMVSKQDGYDRGRNQLAWRQNNRIYPSEPKRKNRPKINDKSLKDLWDKDKRYYISITGVPEREENSRQ